MQQSGKSGSSDIVANLGVRTMFTNLVMMALLLTASGSGAAAGAASAAGSPLDYVKVASASDGPCSALAKREGHLYSVEIIGLEPNERFPVATSSAGETINYTAQANKDGYYLMVLAPQVKGRSSGIAHFSFESAHCRIHLSFPWRDD
jgi:hypothetical protein